MGCVDVRYEKQFTTSVVWIYWFVFILKIFDLEWQLIIKASHIKSFVHGHPPPSENMPEFTT